MMSETHVEIHMDAPRDNHAPFRVLVISRAGMTIPFWSGFTYERAILFAELARADFGMVVDRVHETCPADLAPSLP